MSTILIVEDNPKNLKLVRDLLQAKGYATLESERAEEGLELARTQLRAAPATAGIPVIAITASVMQHNRREIEGAGFDGFIEKPINVRGFLETVRAALATAPR